jgi:hypothetical protein
MEALITLDCSCFSDSITDIIAAFKQIGWSTFNSNGETEYLPVGDNDEYDWYKKVMTESELQSIITAKTSKNERIGINLFYRDGVEGITLLSSNTKEIILCLSINRRTINNTHTDMSWYLENVIYKLLNTNVRIISYKATEYED